MYSHHIHLQFYEVPFYYKIHILWYHKFDFVISLIRFCDITNSLVFCDITKSQNRICDITNSYDFVISQIRFCDITNSILWYHKFITILWYHKFDFVISQNVCGISFLMKNDRSLKIQTHAPVSLVIPRYPRTPKDP